MAKITMTNEELSTNVNVLSAAQETGVLGLALAKNLRKLKTEGKEYLDVKDAAVKKYGEKLTLKDGRTFFFIPDDKKEECEAEYADLMDVTCEVDIATVSEDVFCSGNLTSAQMEVLLWMMEDKK